MIYSFGINCCGSCNMLELHNLCLVMILVVCVKSSHSSSSPLLLVVMTLMVVGGEFINMRIFSINQIESVSGQHATTFNLSYNQMLNLAQSLKIKIQLC